MENKTYSYEKNICSGKEHTTYFVKGELKECLGSRVRTWWHRKGEKKTYELETAVLVASLGLGTIPAHTPPRCDPGSHTFLRPLYC